MSHATPHPAEPAETSGTAATEGEHFGAEAWRPERETKAQRSWTPGQRRRRRSTRAMFTSVVLTLESVVIFFLGMSLFGLNRGEEHALWFAIGFSVLAVVALLTCALVQRPVGIWIGWAIQLVLIVSGFWEYSMFVIGPLFALTWWYAVTKGREIDLENARRDRLEEEWAAEHGS